MRKKIPLEYKYLVSISSLSQNWKSQTVLSHLQQRRSEATEIFKKIEQLENHKRYQLELTLELHLIRKIRTVNKNISETMSLTLLGSSWVMIQNYVRLKNCTNWSLRSSKVCIASGEERYTNTTMTAIAFEMSVEIITLTRLYISAINVTGANWANKR